MLVSSDVWLMFLTKRHPEDQRDKRNIIIYGCLVGACFIFVIIRAFGFHLVSLRCSERLHDKMVVAVLQAPVLFFDSNPVGRIMNRFSKDVGCMDEVLPKTFLLSVQMILLLFASNTCSSCNKSLASVSFCTDNCVSRTYFEVLLENFKGA